MSFKKLKKSLKYRASSLSNARVLNVPDLNKTKSKLRDICSPTVEARCTSVQSFNQAGDLWRRIVTHSKERAYNCVQCNKSFGVAGSLITHMLANSGVKNHTCSECGKSFGQSGHLRSHMITHTGEKVHEFSD